MERGGRRFGGVDPRGAALCAVARTFFTVAQTFFTIRRNISAAHPTSLHVNVGGNAAADVMMKTEPAWLDTQYRRR